MSRGVKARTPRNSHRKPAQKRKGSWDSFAVPASLDEAALDEFARLEAVLVERGVRDMTDPRIVCMAASLHSMIAKAQASLATSEMTLTARNGITMPHPMIGVIANLTTRLRGLLNDMGLTPKAAKMTGNSQPEAAGSDGWDGILNVAS